ncbi:MAG: 50S ribosomal protein L3 [Bacteroidia bacterium]|nr:50S ribosomal protein L3 [Bacteroidia bacterium]MDW8333113.1 50S ribosomal protein L3 [Bacteroidia bacterium]
MAGILGRKLGMTSVFDETRRNIACTLIEAGPCYVTQVKTRQTDGYDAVQVGFDEKREKNTTRPMLGHFRKAGVKPMRLVRELDFNPDEFHPGREIRVEDVFAVGDYVDVVGYSKGRGFAGVVKRHGFAGVGGQTHGQHNRLRHPGSMGACSFPSRVFKGKRLAGRYGNERVTVQNLRVLQIIPEKNVMVVSGAVPGPNGGYLIIKK